MPMKIDFVRSRYYRGRSNGQRPVQMHHRQMLLALLTTSKMSLLGPAYPDLTLASNDTDPITYDQFWDASGATYPAHYVFSYQHQGCIIAMTLPTLKEIDMTHPVTGVPLPDEAVKRAKEILSIYDAVTPVAVSDLATLLSRFRMFGYCLDQSWIDDDALIAEMSRRLDHCCTEEVVAQCVRDLMHIPQVYQAYHYLSTANDRY